MAVCGDYLAVLREQITAAVGCWSFQVRVTKALWVFRGHKKTGAWPVFVFLFALGSEEISLERVAGIEPA